MLFFIYLVAPVLAVARGIQFLDQGLNPGPQHWERVILVTGPSAESHLPISNLWNSIMLKEVQESSPEIYV